MHTDQLRNSSNVNTDIVFQLFLLPFYDTAGLHFLFQPSPLRSFSFNSGAQAARGRQAEPHTHIGKKR